MAAKSKTLAVTSAGVGLFIALAVLAVDLLANQEFFEGVDTFLQVFGLSGLGAVAAAGAIVLVIILVPSAFLGTILVLSTPGRSYIGYCWQGALLVVGGTLLYLGVKRVA